MTNEELKRKIVEILDNNIRWQPYYYISRGIVYEDDLKNIADALIAAGYGDVKEAEHRATVTEIALAKACEDLSKLMDCCRWVSNGGKITVTEYTPENATPQAYIERAEKELAEEGEND